MCRWQSYDLLESSPKAHREGDEANAPLVIKDSWQYPEREEEGKILNEAAGKGVINVARYYHHKTVQVDGKVDDIRDNARRGLDVTGAHYRPACSDASISAANTARKGHSISGASRKRSSSQTGATLPLSKRNCSSSPSKNARDAALENRVHSCVIICDYGTPINRSHDPIRYLHSTMLVIPGQRPSLRDYENLFW